MAEEDTRANVSTVQTSRGSWKIHVQIPACIWAAALKIHNFSFLTHFTQRNSVNQMEVLTAAESFECLPLETVRCLKKRKDFLFLPNQMWMLLLDRTMDHLYQHQRRKPTAPTWVWTRFVVLTTKPVSWTRRDLDLSLGGDRVSC